MDNRSRRAERDAADWQILIGSTSAIFLGLWRLFVATVFALGEEPLWTAALLTTLEAVLCFALAYAVYRGSRAAALGLVAILVLGKTFAVLGGAPPWGALFPFLLLAVGLAQGVRGTYARHRLERERAAARTPEISTLPHN